MMSARSDAVHMMLVDDHPIVRRGVRDILVDAFPHAAIADVGSGAEAISMARADRWDIVILDLTLPDCSGLDVLKRVRERHARLPVLILSMHAPDQFARRVIAAGGSGYLTKDAADAELVTAVGRLLRGGRYFGPDVLERVAMTLHPDAAERPHERLSDREYQVLRLIGSGRRVSQIAEQLGLSVKTVSTYRARVLEKMELRTNADLTGYAVRHGLTE
jgi:two-component system invasion response regulator UvrY